MKNKRFYPDNEVDKFYIGQASPILKHGKFKADAPEFCIGDIVVCEADLWWDEESTHDMDLDPSYVFHDELDALEGSAYLPAGSVFIVDEILVDRSHIENVMMFDDPEDIEFDDGDLFCFRLQYLFHDTMELYPDAVSKLAEHLKVSVDYLDQHLNSAPKKEQKAIYYNASGEYLRLIQTVNFRTFFKDKMFNQTFLEGRYSNSWSVLVYTLPQYPLNVLGLDHNFDSRYFISKEQDIIHKFGPELYLSLTPSGFAQRADQHIFLLEIGPWKDDKTLPEISLHKGGFFSVDINLNDRLVTLTQCAHLEVDYESNEFSVLQFTDAEDFASYVQIEKSVNSDGLVVTKPLFVVSCKASSANIKSFEEWFTKQGEGWLLNYASFASETSKIWLVKIIDYDLIQSFTSFVSTLSDFESHNIPSILDKIPYFVALGDRSELEKTLDEHLSEYPTKYISLVDLEQSDKSASILVIPIFLDFVVDDIRNEDNDVATRFNNFLALSKAGYFSYLMIQTSPL